jgi:NADP-dependent 3-hydroxy acid dehydrogenase YdfG
MGRLEGKVAVVTGATSGMALASGGGATHPSTRLRGLAVWDT